MKIAKHHNPRLQIPSAIDLFCGCGGMTEGLKQAGFQVLWGNDVAAHPLMAYRANHPEVLVDEKDIRQIECKKLMGLLGLKKGDLDLLAGCPPCQGFSSIRTNNGRYSIPDERNDLINDYLRFVEAFRPKVVMLENVPGLKDDARFEIFVATMTDLDYQGEWKILNVADYGVPQRRRRLIYVAAHKKSILISGKINEYRTVRDAIGTLPAAGRSGDFMHDFPEMRTKKVQEMIALIPKDGGSRSQLPEEYILPCHKRNPESFRDVYGRMAWDKPSPTITGGCSSPSKGRFLHPEEDRCITLREAALLQGFPRNYIFPRGLSKDRLALMVGKPFATPPAVQLNDLSTDSKRNIQEGQAQLSRGVVTGFRNPILHAPIDTNVPSVFSELDCLNVLSLVSYLVARLDGATVNT